ncbi:MAG TPA: hemolysin family protein [Methyloceanibacter sp.]|nr:hemolysin family protein [Methyloceanibacter sp.]
MSNAPLSDDELPATGDPIPEEEPSWLERLLARFGLGEEPDLREVIEDALARTKGAGADTFSAQERAMLLNILRVGKLTVEDVMVPRADIIAVEDSITVAELMRVFREAEHSRLPVYHETLDDPLGMIHIRDLMSWITTAAEKNGNNLELGAVDLSSPIAALNIIREILYVPPSMPVLDMLLRMQSSRLHLALVVDEYGGTDGLVSIEDLVEEVVGEIADEHDVAEEPLIREDARHGLIADARAPIETIEERLGVDLVTPEQEEDIDTIGGLVFALAGRIPARGERVSHPSGIDFEVLDADPRLIKKLRIHRPEAREDAIASESA